MFFLFKEVMYWDFFLGICFLFYTIVWNEIFVNRATIPLSQLSVLLYWFRSNSCFLNIWNIFYILYIRTVVQVYWGYMKECLSLSHVMDSHHFQGVLYSLHIPDTWCYRRKFQNPKSLLIPWILSASIQGHRAVYVGVHVPLGKENRHRRRHRGHRHHRRRTKERESEQDAGERECLAQGRPRLRAYTQFLVISQPLVSQVFHFQLISVESIRWSSMTTNEFS